MDSRSIRGRMERIANTILGIKGIKGIDIIIIINQNMATIYW